MCLFNIMNYEKTHSNVLIVYRMRFINTPLDIRYMDKLKDLLQMDPCYEQHIVSIKDIYEEHLFSILVPGIYEGFQSLYKRAYISEEKYIIASKKNPNIENPGILVLFQSMIKGVPDLNTHKIRHETDRIKSSTKSANIFDDLVRAVCKANIILLTYNIDHKRKDLLQSKFHESIPIHDFVHDCYIYAARNFYGCPELFYHKQEPIVLNQNKRACFNIIKDSIREAIRMMLPMKEILIEYITHKYEQKVSTNPFKYNGNLPPPALYNGQFNGQFNGQNYPGAVPGMNQEEFMNVNQMVQRDLSKYQGDNASLLEDDYDPRFDGNEFEDGDYLNKDFSLLLSSESNSISEKTSDRGSNRDSLLDGSSRIDNNHSINSAIRSLSDQTSTASTDGSQRSSGSNDDTGIDEKNKAGGKQLPIIEHSQINKNNNSDSKSDNKSDNKSDDDKSDHGLKIIDISGSMAKKGTSSFIKESLPEINKSLEMYKQNRQKNKSSGGSIESNILKTNQEAIQINRISDTKPIKKESMRGVDKIVDNVLRT